MSVRFPHMVCVRQGMLPRKCGISLYLNITSINNRFFVSILHQNLVFSSSSFNKVSELRSADFITIPITILWRRVISISQELDLLPFFQIFDSVSSFHLADRFQPWRHHLSSACPFLFVLCQQQNVPLFSCRHAIVNLLHGNTYESLEMVHNVWHAILASLFKKHLNRAFNWICTGLVFPESPPNWNKYCHFQSVANDDFVTKFYLLLFRSNRSCCNLLFTEHVHP